ncbi:MAG: nitroreductase family protein [Candidatus Heimdallarchaeota archaeon]|nr:nitroreductase family protein [Candidatus Heimdallarchaeota archaeon]
MSSNSVDTIFEIILNRRSIRSFTDREIPESALMKILEAGWQAPSAGNRQPVEFILIKDPSIKQKISAQEFVEEAAAVIVVIVNLERTTSRYGDRGEKMYIYHDSGAAVQNMLLMCKALGLGSCWIGAFNDERVSKLLELPEHVLPMAIIPIGYPNEDPEPPRKIPLDKIVHKDRYEETKIKEYLMSLVD